MRVTIYKFYPYLWISMHFDLYYICQMGWNHNHPGYDSWSLHFPPFIPSSQASSHRGFRKKAGVQYPPSTSTMTEDYGPAFKLPSLGEKKYWSNQSNDPPKRLDFVGGLALGSRFSWICLEDLLVSWSQQQALLWQGMRDQTSDRWFYKWLRAT